MAVDGRIRLGACFLPGSPPESLPGLARLAEQAGLDELWVWEDCFAHSAIAAAATALAVTERIQVGIGLMPAPLRAVSLTAMELTTLARLHPGRLLPGVGHGVQEWMGQAGVRVASPMTLLREYMTALRSLLAGETVTVEGRYVRLQDVALAWPPDEPLPLYAGGFGDRTLALSAELGDGVLLASARTAEQIEHAARIMRAQGREALPLVATEIFATGEGAAERVAEATAVWSDPGTTTGTAGGVSEMRQRLTELAAAGATTVVALAPPSEPDLARLFETVVEAAT